MARTELPEPSLKMASPLGELDVRVPREGVIELRGVEGLASYGTQEFRTTGLLLEQGPEGWKVVRDQFELLDRPGLGPLADRVIAEIEPATEQWAAEHKAELQAATRVALNNEAARLGRYVDNREQDLSDERRRLAELEERLGPALSPIDEVPRVPSLAEPALDHGIDR